MLTELHQLHGSQPTPTTNDMIDGDVCVTAVKASPFAAMDTGKEQIGVNASISRHYVHDITTGAPPSCPKIAIESADLSPREHTSSPANCMLAGTTPSPQHQNNSNIQSGPATLVGQNYTNLGQEAGKKMGQPAAAHLSTSESSTQSPSPQICKPTTRPYSPLRVRRVLSPPKTRKDRKTLKKYSKKVPRALSLPRPKPRVLVDELDEEDEAADAIIHAINGPLEGTQSDKEIFKDVEGDRGRPKNRSKALGGSEIKGMGSNPNSNQ